jgi:putative transposase
MVQKKSRSDLSLDERRKWIGPDPDVALTTQFDLIGVSRNAYYYEPLPETHENLLLMDLIDREYMAHPFYGSRRMVAVLDRMGYPVSRKRVVRLMRLIGIEAIYPKPNLSRLFADHKKYPYLLRDLPVVRPNQVWATDITYIPVQGGYLYLTAVMDWHTRYILSWRLSNTLDVRFCLEALEESLKYGTPEIFNSDQGSQYTSKEFTGFLESRAIQISMDGKGRAYDNIFVERLWRTIKYEEVYLKRYETGFEAHKGLGMFITFYNEERPHQSLDYMTPKTAYYGLG